MTGPDIPMRETEHSADVVFAPPREPLRGGHR
jgi:hypothetical protein